MVKHNTRKRYGSKLAHANNYKYVDKKLVNGKWVYYYSTPINKEQDLLRKRKAQANAKNINKEVNPAYEERYQKQARAKVNAENVKKQITTSQIAENRMKKQLEREIAQETREKQAANKATNAARKEREIKKEEARVKQEKKAALNKKINDTKKAIGKAVDKAAQDASDYFTGSKAKQKIDNAQKDLDNTVKSNTKAALRGDFKEYIEGNKKVAAKKKAVDTALKDYEKTFPGQINKGTKFVSNLLNGISNKAKDTVESINDKSKFKKAYNENKKNPNLKNAMESAKYNRKIQARKKKKTKK